MIHKSKKINQGALKIRNLNSIIVFSYTPYILMNMRPTLDVFHVIQKSQNSVQIQVILS